ncbi:Fibrinogen-like protein A,Ryncolin-4,Angiopoietin-related protein 1,Ficolin-3,Ficolin-1-B,Techylectin-5A,Ficolin-2,Ryncolin-1,Tenascin-R,Fibrinogen-like protein 1,Tenascin-N,Ryncolin-3,Tenascin,Fibroleukin,Fibrinogen C domain-containing protein 1,Fibrinogen gamma chain,Ryncolin-2,Techylectin-5B,Angiopoietin-related protein 2,Microfibril-associated glycoprotein 4,Fibrinogen alpha chain,Ficolin-1-A,Ficolin-1,Angiopoietin-4 [Mytilus coruscus]|uniref:Fibrinogen C-terminal domain-containing protein n=1 Tax=Mytilus coruscus TaxID=42192 RepID=A0A6J8E3Y5_MYTCO|nr:Fibrinogen-like protein A,Ryncolin-4,Angiopoietin-related protein 1,Ficolin-3,Ficolin-1-B,Techylectin-5A,Ficolin-2,Ryncolin-1,Tenascin-R,Fibrinogen-like protein 1,Tenascin-N,Ryncolin-3,Tenascin,Fibroleukin,Fibrinogen C domain-containing protein 1,Fibrinogen gamma chain,Ryncolin-2,Techylectin-5B,Angiopoietin-related protein 2,Microfibril-associated glycoprotein 4,Fibrinogen alpha chain,Ficolin-1-A,Ficolin-1,Angiopoietin-4 [Mytilus coruscus]
MNSISIIIAFSLTWYGDINVTASGLDTKDLGNGDPLSIPLINDKGAPLVVMLDTNIINRNIKAYISTLIRNMIQNSVEEQIKDIFKTSLEENSTIDFMRNITMQGINDVLKDREQEKILHPVGNEEVIHARKSPDDLRVDDIMYEVQEKCLPANHSLTAEDIKRDTQNILNNVVLYKEIVELNKQVKDKIKWILKESGDEKHVSEILRMLTRDVKASGVCAIKTAKDCTDLLKYISHSDVYMIYPNKHEVKVYCDMTTDGGGWTIIQRRLDGSVNFQRTWKDYENGFGNVDGEYWLGNKHIHSLTSSGTYELRIDLTDLSHTKKYAVYKTFVVDDATSKYKLNIGRYSGNAGDRMDYHNGMQFSTEDEDNDAVSQHCAKEYGAWWHKYCCESSLNRKFNKNLYWYQFSSNSAKTSVMMLRKAGFMEQRTNQLTAYMNNFKSELLSLKRTLPRTLCALESQIVGDLLHYSYNKAKASSKGKRIHQFPNDCTTIRKQNHKATSGVHTVFPEDEEAVRVYCDMDTDGGGGHLTSSGKYELRIDLTDLFNKKKYAVCIKLLLLEIQRTSDNMANQNGTTFSATDQDNDKDSGTDCSETFGSWWHKHCCARSLNRRYFLNPFVCSMSTNTFKRSAMMLRKV